ncbi:AraC family transcriptional regulator [Nocardioides zeae]|uniref:AraC family transcriptional regulator n=1 Tax=Nocardioides imazamoxiresistens TaxID=3231893 RepID=A0ABU3PVN5_9ACTN|nr:AraC family transcriptional regulator [Nocardioides zeae]MDT9593305.1 AraC family transcriptional regulator [Nocardioides zeae]
MKRVLRTDDREVAESTVSSTYEPSHIEVGSRQSFEFTLDAAQLTHVVAGRLHVRKPSRLYGTEPSGQYHVALPLTGGVVCAGAAEQPMTVAPGRASVWGPGQVPDTHWAAGTTLMCFMVPPDVVAAEAKALLGRDILTPVVFEPKMDLTSPGGRSWWRLVNLLAGELEADSGLIQETVTRHHFERLLVEGLLLAHRHSLSDVMEQRSRSSTVQGVARAIELVEEDPAAPWSALSLANRVHLSVRSLQEGFRRELDTSPMSHVRDVRLRRVFDDLNAAPPGPTVNQIAQRWGFLHMGRFADHYRRQYGELPSVTRRRALGGA